MDFASIFPPSSLISYNWICGTVSCHYIDKRCPNRNIQTKSVQLVIGKAGDIVDGANKGAFRHLVTTTTRVRKESEFWIPNSSLICFHFYSLASSNLLDVVTVSLARWTRLPLPSKLKQTSFRSMRISRFPWLTYSAVSSCTVQNLNLCSSGVYVKVFCLACKAGECGVTSHWIPCPCTGVLICCSG